MIRTKWIVGVRNKLVNYAMECDSVAAIEDARMTTSEREELQKRIRKAVEYIDSKIFNNK